MKIVVVGSEKNSTALFNDFKKHDFIHNRFEFFDWQLTDLDEYDTIINTCDINEDSTTISTSAMYMYNAEIPAILSKYCKETGKKFVHISSGNIYGNSIIPQLETDSPSVKTAYEASKLLGEKYCNENDLIIRTVNLFNSDINPTNSLYRLIKNPSNIDIPISFSYTLDVIRSISRLLRLKEQGIFNVTSNGIISPYLISPAPEYLKKTSIFDLNPTENVVNILNTDKLFQFHVTDNVSDIILECYENIIEKIRDADANTTI